jgi:YihY family inner membrane protein
MSTASFVPETGGVSGDDVKQVLERPGRARLAADAVRRFIAADCTTHARALAYSGVLVFLPALIALIGLTVLLGLPSMRAVVEQAISGLAPGRSGEVLNEALRQGTHAAGSGALVAGVLAAVVAGAVAMAQVERGANRLYGIEVDRPFVRRYTRALLIQVTAGSLLFVGVMLVAAGAGIADAIGGTGGTVALVIRWPLAILFVTVALAIVMKLVPYRSQPRFSWLFAATAISVVLWIASSILLGLYFRLDGAISETYGPLLGVIGLLVWSFLTALSIFAGFAFAAQMEAVRSGRPGPTRDRQPSERAARPTEKRSDAEAVALQPARRRLSLRPQ